MAGIGSSGIMIQKNNGNSNIAKSIEVSDTDAGKLFWKYHGAKQEIDVEKLSKKYIKFEKVCDTICEKHDVKNKESARWKLTYFEGVYPKSLFEAFKVNAYHVIAGLTVAIFGTLAVLSAKPTFEIVKNAITELSENAETTVNGVQNIGVGMFFGAMAFLTAYTTEVLAADLKARFDESMDTLAGKVSKILNGVKAQE
ncbi:MAG: hypothetical protein WC492_04375 [Candidatus Micrarchaeia archaeon]